MDDRKEQTEIEAFQNDVKYFLSKEQFNIFDFHERVTHALKQKSSFKMMIWGDDAEVKVLETQNKVCSAMTEEEKTECKLSNQQKIDVAEASQTTREDVEDVL